MRTRILIDRGVPFEYMLIAFTSLVIIMIIYNLLVILKGRGLKTWIKKILSKIFSPIIKLLKKVFFPIIKLSKFIGNKIKLVFKFIWKVLKRTAWILWTPFRLLFSLIKKIFSPITNFFKFVGKNLKKLTKKIFSIFPKKNKNKPFDSNIHAFNGIKLPKSKLKNKQTKLSKLLKKINFKFYLINLFFIIVLSIIGFDIQGPSGVRWTYPKQDAYLTSYEEPIAIEFDRPFNEDAIKPYIFPEIQGEWKAESKFEWFPWTKTIMKFYPEESMFHQKVFIYYADITDYFTLSDTWEYGIDAKSVPIPVVQDISPANETLDFPADGKIIIHLDVPADHTSEWTLKSEPEVKYSINYDNGSFIEINFDNKLKHNTDYTFTIEKSQVRYNIESGEIVERKDPEIVKTFKIKTVKAPLIETISPDGQEILINTPIEIVFDTPMVKEGIEQNFSITPNITGATSWKDDRTFVFTPDAPFTKDTKYIIAFPKQLKSLKGGYTETEITHEFKSIGPVKVNSFGPGGYSVSRGANIIVNFNQAVNHASAQSHFSISPNVSGVFSWSGNTMYFNPSADLGYETTYTIKVTAGVQTINGLNSNQVFTHSFKTQVARFILNVPVYYQRLRFSCNLVASRMALAKKGVYISTMTAYGGIAKDTTPYNAANNTFGNPYAGYTGDIYGRSKGYGAYWGPISGMIGRYRSNSVRTGWNRTAALQEVQKGNPVIIWAHNGYSGSGGNISWHTPSGQYIYAIKGMHSYVLVGWEGDINNPKYIYLNDPNRGRWKISTGYFDGLWGYFNRSAVVVY